MPLNPNTIMNNSDLLNEGFMSVKLSVLTSFVVVSRVGIKRVDCISNLAGCVHKCKTLAYVVHWLQAPFLCSSVGTGSQGKPALLTQSNLARVNLGGNGLSDKVK